MTFTYMGFFPRYGFIEFDNSVRLQASDEKIYYFPSFPVTSCINSVHVLGTGSFSLIMKKKISWP